MCLGNRKRTRDARQHTCLSPLAWIERARLYPLSCIFNMWSSFDHQGPLEAYSLQERGSTGHYGWGFVLVAAHLMHAKHKGDPLAARLWALPCLARDRRATRILYTCTGAFCGRPTTRPNGSSGKVYARWLKFKAYAATSVALCLVRHGAPAGPFWMTAIR